jgi:hypothetical protein
MTEHSTDHAARARRLREFAASWSQVRTDTFAISLDPDDDDDETVSVPHRFALAQRDETATWIAFADTLKAAQAVQAATLDEDPPRCPCAVIDLDTGATFDPIVTVGLVRAPLPFLTSDQASPELGLAVASTETVNGPCR